MTWHPSRRPAPALLLCGVLLAAVPAFAEDVVPPAAGPAALPGSGEAAAKAAGAATAPTAAPVTAPARQVGVVPQQPLLLPGVARRAADEPPAPPAPAAAPAAPAAARPRTAPTPAPVAVKAPPPPATAAVAAGSPPPPPAPPAAPPAAATTAPAAAATAAADDDAEPQAPVAAAAANAVANPALHRNAEQYCSNIVDAAADARFARQAELLKSLEAGIEARIIELERKRAEYETWLTRRDAFLEKADASLIEIYSRMRPDAAAAQLALMSEETAAAILMKLKPRGASAILNEMEPAQAALISNTIAGAARRGQSKEVSG